MGNLLFNRNYGGKGIQIRDFLRRVYQRMKLNGLITMSKLWNE